jgi:tRNA1(Val) A37 N6-methylase TrmN6
MDAVTDDAAFAGRLALWQSRRGYRFSADALLLVWFASRFGAVDRAVDIGAGCGIVGLGLLAAGTAATVTGVEIQPALAELARRNASRNGLAGRYRLVSGGLAQLLEDPDLRGVCDLVVSNPPFWPGDQGRLPACEQRRVACHEISLDLDGWVGAARRLLATRRGRLCAVFPARRLGPLLTGLAAHGLAGERLLPVFPRAADPAELVLLSARLGTRERLVIEPPLVLRDAVGGDTAAARSILEGTFSPLLASRPDVRRIT